MLTSSRPPLRFDGEHEWVDRTGPRLAEQPGDQGERPAGVGPVIDEQDRLPGQPRQRRGDRDRHLVGAVNGAEPLRTVRATAMWRTNVLDAAEVGQPSDPGESGGEAAHELGTGAGAHADDRSGPLAPVPGGEHFDSSLDQVIAHIRASLAMRAWLTDPRA